MTMHIEGPWLSTTGKSKKKHKFRNAEEARKSRELDASWKELLKRQGIEQEERRKTSALKAPTLVYSLPTPPGRNTTKHIKSLGQDNGVATLKAPLVYTGNKVKGIATMHKSNAVPVFSDEEAVEISKMRRG
jgi:hypothetical protein